MNHDKLALLGGALQNLRLPKDVAPTSQGSVAVIGDNLCAYRNGNWEQVLRLAAPALEQFLQERGAYIYSHLDDNAANNSLTNIQGNAGRLLLQGTANTTQVNTNARFNTDAKCIRIVNNARIEFDLPTALPINADYAIGCIYRPNATVPAGYNSSVISLYYGATTTQQQTAASHTVANGNKYNTSYKIGNSSSRSFNLTKDEWNVVILSLNAGQMRQICYVPHLDTSDSTTGGMQNNVGGSPATRFVIGQSVSGYQDKSIIGDIKEVFMIPKGLSAEEMTTLRDLMAAVA